MQIYYYILIILLFLTSKVFAIGEYNFPISKIYVEPVEIHYEKHCPIDYSEDVYFYLNNCNNCKKYRNIIELLNREHGLSYSDGMEYLASSYKNKKIQKPRSRKEIIY